MRNKKITPHAKGWRTNLTYVGFVDDVLIFCKGNEASIRAVNDCIWVFTGATYMVINKEKTTLITRGMDVIEVQDLADIMGISLATTPVKYLGLPLISGRLKTKECLPLLERILVRMANWKNKCLSYAGRVELIKSVLSSYCQYWTRTYILPNNILDRVKSLTNKFLWEGPSAMKKIHQASKKKYVREKNMEG